MEGGSTGLGASQGGLLGEVTSKAETQVLAVSQQSGEVARSGEMNQVRLPRGRPLGEALQRLASGGVGAACLVRGEQGGCQKPGAGGEVRLCEAGPRQVAQD